MKYNWSIIGHEKQLKQIEQDIASGNLSHAYLLAGPNSVGKNTVAKKMAGILQCENDFCHKCPTCLQVEKGTHVDTIELRDDKESIKIADVRSLIERLNMSSQSKYAVALIENIERMTPEAANSFLKILEEPPLGTIFIITTNNVQALLPTIVSRVRVVKFRSFSVGYLKEKLHELYPDREEETVKQASLLSLGRIGKAVHLMENMDSMADYLKVYRDVQGFLNHRNESGPGNITDRFLYIEDIVSDQKQTDIFLDILTHVLRSKLLEGGASTGYCVNSLSKIEEAGILLKKNINARLVLENLMLAL